MEMEMDQVSECIMRKCSNRCAGTVKKVRGCRRGSSSISDHNGPSHLIAAWAAYVFTQDPAVVIDRSPLACHQDRPAASI